MGSLGLRKMDLSMSALTKQREEVVQTQIRLDAEMRERQRLLVNREETKMKDLEQQRLELQRQTELERHKMEAAKAQLESSSGQSSYGSGSSGGSSSAQAGQPHLPHILEIVEVVLPKVDHPSVKLHGVETGRGVDKASFPI